MAVFDATALLLFLEPDARPPLDPETGAPMTDVAARIEFLVDTLEEQRETIAIPTPALSEVLVHAGDAGPAYPELLNGSRCFRIEPFDERAAVELAAMTREAMAAGDLRAGTDATRAKLKFDRQIVAIALTPGRNDRLFRRRRYRQTRETPRPRSHTEPCPPQKTGTPAIRPRPAADIGLLNPPLHARAQGFRCARRLIVREHAPCYIPACANRYRHR